MLKVHELVSNVTGQPLVNQEFIQIVKYEIGQQYVDHHDTSDGYKQFSTNWSLRDVEPTVPIRLVNYRDEITADDE